MKSPGASPNVDGLQQPKARIPTAIWALGFTSFFMDMSSEMIHALLPLYLTGVLGASVADIGWIEGIVEATAIAVKVASGAISDWFGKRKFLAVLGYGLAAITKPVFPLANSVSAVVAALFIDRIGKGIRGAPRDALVADLVAPEMRGAAYGLRQAFDTAGAVIGPGVATLLMLWTVSNYRFVFWVAFAPAFISVAVLVYGVREPNVAAWKPVRFPLARAAIAQLPRAFWIVTLIGFVLALARVNEGFLILRATGAGLRPAYAPLVLVAMNVVYAAIAYPGGKLADKLPTTTLIVLAIVSLFAAEGVLAWNGGLALIFAGLGLWGLHMALSQGLLSKLVANHAPEQLRGSAFGIFNLASAAALLLGNALFGALWAEAGPQMAYGVAAIVGLAALPVLVLLPRQKSVTLP